MLVTVGKWRCAAQLSAAAILAAAHIQLRNAGNPNLNLNGHACASLLREIKEEDAS